MVGEMASDYTTVAVIPCICTSTPTTTTTTIINAEIIVTLSHNFYMFVIRK